MNNNEPIHLKENEDTGDRFLVYASEKGEQIEIQFEGDTLWMTQVQIGQLFGRDRSSITRHINNIIEEGELPEDTSVQKVHKSHGRPTTIYNLDMVISVGYRVSSTQATVFRRWATSVLVQYAKKGFIVDSPRLKQTNSISRIRELKEIIRDIRSDESNMYAELRAICAMCQDYDGHDQTARTFYQQTQAKLVYAVTSHTPSEIIHKRANYKADNMGLSSWPNVNIRKADVKVAKNYLAESEVRELNRLTSILLDIFEDQADLGKLIIMADAVKLLDNQLSSLNRVVLRSGGRISSAAAKTSAENHFEKYKEKQRIARQEQANQNISELTQSANSLKSRK